MSLLPVKKYPPAGKQGCKPQERGAAPALGGSQPVARDQLDSCLQLPGNSCDGCAQDTARAGPPRAGAPDAGLAGSQRPQRPEQTAGGRGLLSRKRSARSNRAAMGTAPAGGPAAELQARVDPRVTLGQLAHPHTHRRHSRARGPTPMAGGPRRLSTRRAAQGAEARCSQGHPAGRREEAPNARPGSPRSTVWGHGRDCRPGHTRVPASQSIRF